MHTNSFFQRRLWVESVELRSRILIHPLTLAPALRNLRSAKATLPIAQATYCLFSHAQYLPSTDSRSGAASRPVIFASSLSWGAWNSCFFVFPIIFTPKIDHKGLTEALPLYQTKKVVSENVNVGRKLGPQQSVHHLWGRLPPEAWAVEIYGFAASRGDEDPFDQLLWCIMMPYLLKMNI